MFGSSQSGANAYAKVGLETGVVAASPHKLIVMLFDGALAAVRAAVVHMKAREIEKKGLAISKAIIIIENGLRASLDKEAGGQIAHSLDSLYDYIGRRLLTANLTNQPEMLDEVIALLADLKGAWEAIGDNAAPPAAAAPARPMAYDSLAPRSRLFCECRIMMNSDQVISLYETVSELTGQMLQAAQSRDWENLAALESALRQPHPVPEGWRAGRRAERPDPRAQGRDHPPDPRARPRDPRPGHAVDGRTGRPDQQHRRRAQAVGGVRRLTPSRARHARHRGD